VQAFSSMLNDKVHSKRGLEPRPYLPRQKSGGVMGFMNGIYHLSYNNPFITVEQPHVLLDGIQKNLIRNRGYTTLVMLSRGGHFLCLLGGLNRADFAGAWAIFENRKFIILSLPLPNVFSIFLSLWGSSPFLLYWLLCL
jgi:hypothetical protein